MVKDSEEDASSVSAGLTTVQGTSISSDFCGSTAGDKETPLGLCWMKGLVSNFVLLDELPEKALRRFAGDTCCESTVEAKAEHFRAVRGVHPAVPKF